MVTAHKYTVATATESIPRNYHVVLCIFMARGSAHPGDSAVYLKSRNIYPFVPPVNDIVEKKDTGII